MHCEYNLYEAEAHADQCRLAEAEAMERSVEPRSRRNKAEEV